MRPDSPPPVTDSPWFWVYLFASIALIGLLFIEPKFEQRQSSIERKGQARRTAKSETSRSQATEEDRSSPDVSVDPLQTVSLRPLVFMLAGAMAVGWVLFFLRRKVQRQKFIDASNQH